MNSPSWLAEESCAVQYMVLLPESQCISATTIVAVVVAGVCENLPEHDLIKK